MKRLEFLDGSRKFKQSVTSRDMIAFVSGVHCALENAGFSITQDMDTGEWLAYRNGDGVLALIFSEKDGGEEG